AASRTEQHPCLLLPPAASDAGDAADASISQCSLSWWESTPCGEPSRMKAPITSYPSRSSSAAATELSTPPLMATTTFFFATAIRVEASALVSVGQQRPNPQMPA